MVYQMATMTMQIMGGMPQQQAPPATQKKKADRKMYNILKIVIIMGQMSWITMESSKQTNSNAYGSSSY